MFKRIESNVWAFDAEWVPDPVTGRALYELPADMPDSEVFAEIWRQNGATDEEPQPYLKAALCRVVSIAAVTRRRREDGTVDLKLVSLPRNPEDPRECTEAAILERFLRRVGERNPALVGFNSQNSDLPVFIQRAVANGVAAQSFCARPAKPWEGRDYFARDTDWNIDLMRLVGGWGKATPALAELAAACGIPGKLDNFHGGLVAETWLAGDLRRIVEYNECDALTTYLLWLRVAHFAGFLSAAEYETEQASLRTLLTEKAQEPGNEYLGTYLEEWDRLRALVAEQRAAAPDPAASADA